MNTRLVFTTNKKTKIGRKQKVKLLSLPFYLEVKSDKNGQICEVCPRTFHGFDLFSRYYGKPINYVEGIVAIMKNINEEIYGNY